METILTIPEVAEYLKMSKAKVYIMVQKNEIPHLKLGRNVRIKESELLKWLDQQKEYPENTTLLFQSKGSTEKER